MSERLQRIVIASVATAVGAPIVLIYLIIAWKTVRAAYLYDVWG